MAQYFLNLMKNINQHSRRSMNFMQHNLKEITTQTHHRKKKKKLENQRQKKNLKGSNRKMVYHIQGHSNQKKFLTFYQKSYRPKGSGMTYLKF